MEEIIIKMENRVKEEIEAAKAAFEVSQTYDSVGNAKIIGMLEMLNIVTGRHYTYGNDGLHKE